MWGVPNDDSMMDGDYGSGGFSDTTNQLDSPSKDKSGAKRAQSITPVVISMIQECKTEEFTIWGNPTSILKLVCKVRKFDVTSTTVTYEIEDDTGSMKAVLWLEHDAGTEPNIPVDKENVYVHVFGTLRTKAEEKLIMILKIAPISSLNELTCHLLETIHTRVMWEKISKGEANVIRANNPGAQLSNSMMVFGGGMEMEEEGMTPIQRKVFKYMKSVNTKIGISRSNVMNNFPPEQRKDVSDAVDFLVSEGHIYSTIDLDHFQLTAA